MFPLWKQILNLAKNRFHKSLLLHKSDEYVNVELSPSGLGSGITSYVSSGSLFVGSSGSGHFFFFFFLEKIIACNNWVYTEDK